MKIHTYLPEEQLFEKAVTLLIDKLGPAETRRFLSITKPKRMESVKRHRLWQSNLDEEKFLEEMFGPETEL
ncbi:MAG: hypothetical protein HYZ34_03815 [Ignavibacteriae bacterium]|nr:hypothetical protein [Ignavibacteriota bacterium]